MKEYIEVSPLTQASNCSILDLVIVCVYSIRVFSKDFSAEGPKLLNEMNTLSSCAPNFFRNSPRFVKWKVEAMLL